MLRAAKVTVQKYFLDPFRDIVRDGGREIGVVTNDVIRLGGT